jgi:hypothetical protein
MAYAYEVSKAMVVDRFANVSMVIIPPDARYNSASARRGSGLYRHSARTWEGTQVGIAEQRSQ